VPTKYDLKLRSINDKPGAVNNNAYLRSFDEKWDTPPFVNKYKVKINGVFVDSVGKAKIAGSFVVVTRKVKIGGVFVAV
jgi:hypothetical protein